MIGGIERDQLGFFADTRIAGGGVKLRTCRGLRQLPGQRMFAPTRPDQKDIHGRPLWREWPRRGRPKAGSAPGGRRQRSEEHTSELQSLMRNSYAVFCLKKTKQIIKHS